MVLHLIEVSQPDLRKPCLGVMAVWEGSLRVLANPLVTAAYRLYWHIEARASA